LPGNSTTPEEISDEPKTATPKTFAKPVADRLPGRSAAIARS
jgi:hypothetical protein